MIKKLNERPDKNPFKVPENYFEEVNRKIISETSGYTLEVKKNHLINKIRPYLLIAASVSAFIFLSYTAVKLLTPEKSSTQVSEVLSYEYPEMYLNDIDITTLEENVATQDLFEELPDVDNNDIIEYLVLNDIEINDIYEQL